MKHKGIFKIMAITENIIATAMLMIGSCMMIGQTGNLKQEILINLAGFGMMLFALWDLS